MRIQIIVIACLIPLLPACSLYQVARETNPNGYEGPNAIQRWWKKQIP